MLGKVHTFSIRLNVITPYMYVGWQGAQPWKRPLTLHRGVPCELLPRSLLSQCAALR